MCACMAVCMFVCVCVCVCLNTLHWNRYENIFHCFQNYMVYVTSAIAQNAKALDYCRMTLYGFTCNIDLCK